MEKFIPVKIIDEKWANKLLDGEVFMRPLHEFGTWGVEEADDSVKNSFRGDLGEGTSAVFKNSKDCDFLKDVDHEFVDILKRVYYVDDEIQYFKVYSMYCMEYNPDNDFFFKPNPRMKEFGDTAVIIRDFNEFLCRCIKAIFEKYEFVSILLDRVNFYDFSVTKQINPLFNKSNDYSYQNELRLAFAELEHNRFARGEHAKEAMSLIQDLKRIKLQIGNIRDIAYKLPIEDFLKLKLKNLPLKFPMHEPEQTPSNFDNSIQFTREQIENYNRHKDYAFANGR